MIILSMIALVIVLIDQVLKSIVMGNLVLNEVVDLKLIKIEYIPKYSNLLGADLNTVFIILSIVFGALFAFWFLTKFAIHVKNKYNYIPFILVLGGLISNIIDRIMRGFIVTFVKIPLILQDISFNFADICVVVGLFLTVIFYLIKVNNDAFEKIDLNTFENREKKKWFWK